MHYGQVGNDYWTAYIGHIVTAFAQRRLSIYGRKTDAGAGRIAISEAWGNYIGGTFNARKYDLVNRNVSVASRANLENQQPNDNVDDDNGWIVYGMLHDMTDTGEPTFTGVTDDVDTYTTPELFRALQSDVVSVRHYQQRVLLQNSNKQAPQLEQLVTSYRW
ncbi:hypothetical protein [Hymenobacter elongatus]|uniref:Uncharacterized protein n=1 Tax=Hymenobacter elongatus TaxID=877208 RepID=A0A4Z0PM67_9BACT|nr:hypothetical protein [Hymenobacter elongatus]TGE15266.1 hypothetical protein E5J99_12880 [Hymenobacter elongatus]